MGIWISTDPTFATYTTLYDGVNPNYNVSTSSYVPTPLIAPYTLEYGKTYYVRVILPGTVSGASTDYFMDVFGFNGYCQTDTDSDYIANTLDLDSDNDGCPDSFESGTTSTNTSIVSSPFGANGFADGKETTIESGVYNGTYTYANAINSTVITCPIPCSDPL